MRSVRKYIEGDAETLRHYRNMIDDTREPTVADYVRMVAEARQKPVLPLTATEAQKREFWNKVKRESDYHIQELEEEEEDEEIDEDDEWDRPPKRVKEPILPPELFEI